MPAYLQYANPFTSREEMEYVLSADGVDFRVQDAPEEKADYCVHKGTAAVHFYLSEVATEAVLSSVLWVRIQASIAASYYLTGTGGEPFNSTLEAEWEEAKGFLSQIQAKQARVPGFTPASPRDGCPVIVNPRLDMQRIPSQRRIAGASTDFPEGWIPPYDWPTAWRMRT